MTAQEFFKNDRFATNAGVELIEIKEGYSKARLVITAEHLNAGGRTQGGAIFTLADLALAAAANSHGTLAFSLSSNITFLRSSGPGDVLYAEARERYIGRTTGYYQIDVTNQEGKLIATFESSVFRKGDNITFSLPQIHVQANGKVVLIIGYEEGDDLLLLTFLVLYEREYQAAVNGVVIRLDLLLAAVNQRLLFHPASRGHGKEYLLPYLVVFRVIRARLRQNAQHIEDTATITVFHLLSLTHGIVPGASLLYIRQSVRVGEPSLVHRMAASLLRRFTEVERLQPIADITSQRITHLEEKIGLFTAYTKQVKAKCRLGMVSRGIGSEACQTHLLPNELPIEI